MFELLGDLDPALVDGAEAAPKKRRRFVLPAALSAAACAAVLILTALFRPMGGSAGADRNGGASSGGNANGTQWIDAVVTETEDRLAVTPQEGDPLYGVYTEIVLTMTDYAPVPDNMPADLQIGDLVRVMCNKDRLIDLGDGTAQAPIVFAVYRRSELAFSVRLQEMYAQLEAQRQKTADTLNDLYAGSLPRPVAAEDVDPTEGFVIFVDTNVFALDTDSMDTVRAALERGNFICLLPLRIGNVTLSANFQVGLPLRPDAPFTGEERREVLENVGKWIASAYALYETDAPDYYAALRARLGEVPDGTLLVGSLPFFRDTAALVPDGEGNVSKIVRLGSWLESEDLLRDAAISESVYDYAKVRDIWQASCQEKEKS